MSDDELGYRIISDPSWQIQKRYGLRWVTVWYCTSEEAARSFMEKAIRQAEEWAALTDEERLGAILR